MIIFWILVNEKFWTLLPAGPQHPPPNSLSNSCLRELKKIYRGNSYFDHSFSSQVLSGKLLS